MNKIKRMFKMRRIMRLLNKFKKTDIAYMYLENYWLECEFYGNKAAEDKLLNIGYNTILNEITDELFKRLKEIA